MTEITSIVATRMNSKLNANFSSIPGREKWLETLKLAMHEIRIRNILSHF